MIFVKKRKIVKHPKSIMAVIVVFVIALSYFIPFINVVANEYGTGDKQLSIDVDNKTTVTVNSVTVNGHAWNSHNDIYRTNNDNYRVIISVTVDNDDPVPLIAYSGDFRNYIDYSVQPVDNTYTFTLDIDLSTSNLANNERFIGLSIEEDTDATQTNFDGKAYVVWSCGTGTCYHYFDDIPAFNTGNSTFYKDTEVLADNDNSLHFDVHAQYREWILKENFDRWVSYYKRKNNIDTNEEIDWTQVKPSEIIGGPRDMNQYESGAYTSGACDPLPEDASPEDKNASILCIDEYVFQTEGLLPVVQLQPVGEPKDTNAYVSYGDRNFKVVIYNDGFKGVTTGNLSGLNYYPSQWANPFTRTDQYDISATTKAKPKVIDSILLEDTVYIQALNYNDFEIVSMEALDVPENAVTITKVEGKFKLEFSSNFYDSVVFKVKDSNNEYTYLQVKRYTIDGYVRRVDDKPVITAEFYFDRTKSYSNFKLTAKVIYKNGTIKTLPMEAQDGIDDGLLNISEGKEVDEEHPQFGPPGKGLKKSVFQCDLEGTEDDVSSIYIIGEYNGSTNDTYAGAYVGSGKGVLVHIERGE